MIGRRGWLRSRVLRRKVERALHGAPDPYGSYLRRVPTELGRPAPGVELLALDLETDGLDARSDSILQVGFVPLRVGTEPPDFGGVELAGAVQIDVAGEGDLRPSSVVVHGITDERRAEGVPLAVALERALGALAGRTLVAHCAEVERAFLDTACRQVFGIPFVGATICTLELERRWFPGPRASDGFRLGKLRARHGLPHAPAHSALGDAIACAELLMAQVAARRSADLELADLVERV